MKLRDARALFAEPPEAEPEPKPGPRFTVPKGVTVSPTVKVKGYLAEPGETVELFDPVGDAWRVDVSTTTPEIVKMKDGGALPGLTLSEVRTLHQIEFIRSTGRVDRNNRASTGVESHFEYHEHPVGEKCWRCEEIFNAPPLSIQSTEYRANSLLDCPNCGSSVGFVRSMIVGCSWCKAEMPHTKWNDWARSGPF